MSNTITAIHMDPQEIPHPYSGAVCNTLVFIQETQLLQGIHPMKTARELKDRIYH